MFNKKETLDRLRINFTEGYKISLDIIYGFDAWNRIKQKKGLTDCQMEIELDECRDYYLKEFSEAELFKFSMKSDETIREFFIELLFEAQDLDLNIMLFDKTANHLAI